MYNAYLLLYLIHFVCTLVFNTHMSLNISDCYRILKRLELMTRPVEISDELAHILIHFILTM